jgi:hypothetical protein
VTLNVQPAGCETDTVWPLIVNEPDRAGPVLAVTANCTCPSPAPDALDVIAIQGAFDAADHGHPAPVRTATVLAPPPAGAV